ncbi:MAG: UTP--glucose-1-phosphate uridylyltransferase GalU [Pseudomonadota bacterium]|nr:UTP--glucose-1-phosphate uridylyltransferase GalU [Pseudomonadota bacterium]
MAQKIRKAVFPVGGLGTRFLPATKALPKEMLPIVDKPLIQYAVEEAAAAGIEEFVFVTGRGKQAIEDHFDISYELDQTLSARGRDDLVNSLRSWMPNPGQITYTRQMDPLGLGHAVWCARKYIDDEPFAVLLADDLVLASKPCLQQLIESYQITPGNIVAAMEVLPEHTDRYGILDVEKDEGQLVSVKGLVEKPLRANAPSNLAIIGRYILMPEVFDHLAEKHPGAGGEIQLTDALAKMVNSMPFYGLRFEGRRFDCGDKVGFLEANLAFALNRDDMKTDVEKLVKLYT